jgi:gas vesicle protein
MAKNTQRDEIEKIIAYSSPGKFFFQGMVLGALIGGTLALLYAPAKGSDTRQFIRDKAEDAARMIQDKAGDIKEMASEVAEDVQGKAAETRRRGEEALRAVKESKI